MLFPERCVVCASPGRPLCAPCRGSFSRLAPPVCERCGAPGAWPVRRCAECAGRRLAFARARAAIVYDEPARALVGTWKERGRRDLAAHAAELVTAGVARPDVEALTFVPSDFERGLSRGHAPAERLARELASRWELSWLRLLGRPRTGPPQRGLPLPEP